MNNQNMPKTATELFIKEYLELKEENKRLISQTGWMEKMIKTESDRYTKMRELLEEVIKAFEIQDDGDRYISIENTFVRKEEVKELVEYLAEKKEQDEKTPNIEEEGEGEEKEEDENE